MSLNAPCSRPISSRPPVSARACRSPAPSCTAASASRSSGRATRPRSARMPHSTSAAVARVPMIVTAMAIAAASSRSSSLASASRLELRAQRVHGGGDVPHALTAGLRHGGPLGGDVGARPLDQGAVAGAVLQDARGQRLRGLGLGRAARGVAQLGDGRIEVGARLLQGRRGTPRCRRAGSRARRSTSPARSTRTAARPRWPARPRGPWRSRRPGGRARRAARRG